jgi:two-component system, OmpR family, response regulator ChvI
MAAFHTLTTYKTFLTIEGYNVHDFTDPREALVHFAQSNPDYYNLVVMDIRMPNLNGLQLYYRLKAINPDIRIMFVSALDAYSLNLHFFRMLPSLF